MSHHEKPTKEEREASTKPGCACAECAVTHGDQAPDPLEVENDRLRAEVIALKRERDRLFYAAAGFCEEVDRARAHADRPRGGQHVTPSGDFVHVQPAALGRLECWSRLFREGGESFDYATKVLAAERDAAMADVAKLNAVLSEYEPSHRPDCRRGLPSALRPCTCGLFDAIGPLSDREIAKRLAHPDLGPWDAASIWARGNR